MQNLKRPPPPVSPTTPQPGAPPAPPASRGGTPLPGRELQERGTPPPEGRVAALEALDSCRGARVTRPAGAPSGSLLFLLGPGAPTLAPPCPSTPSTALSSPPLFPTPGPGHLPPLHTPPTPSVPFVHSLKFCPGHSAPRLRGVTPCPPRLAPFSACPAPASEASGVSADPGEAARGSPTCPLPSTPP